jgi:hypothetical protein
MLYVYVYIRALSPLPYRLDVSYTYAYTYTYTYAYMPCYIYACMHLYALRIRMCIHALSIVWTCPIRMHTYLGYRCVCYICMQYSYVLRMHHALVLSIDGCTLYVYVYVCIHIAAEYACMHSYVLRMRIHIHALVLSIDGCIVYVYVCTCMVASWIYHICICIRIECYRSTCADMHTCKQACMHHINIQHLCSFRV